MIRSLRPDFVEAAPAHLEEGVFYISLKFKTALHLCCCGCGREVVTPLGPAAWSIRQEGEAVSLHPSIGNWGFPCKSHYWIRRNRVEWASPYSEKEIERVRERDRRDMAATIAMSNLRKDQQPGPVSGGWFIAHRVAATVSRWWKGLIG